MLASPFRSRQVPNAGGSPNSTGVLWLPHPTPHRDRSRTSAWMMFQAFLSPTLFSVLYSSSPSFRSCLAFSFTWQMRGNTTGLLRPGHWLSSLTQTGPAGNAGAVFLDREGKWLGSVAQAQPWGRATFHLARLCKVYLVHVDKEEDEQNQLCQ